jgi:hypothetical protein
MPELKFSVQTAYTATLLGDYLDIRGQQYAFGCLRERALCHSACKFWKPIDTLKRRVSVWLEANAGGTNISASGGQGNDGRIVEYQERRNESLKTSLPQQPTALHRRRGYATCCPSSSERQTYAGSLEYSVAMFLAIPDLGLRYWMELKTWMERAGKSPARPLKKRISD